MEELNRESINSALIWIGITTNNICADKVLL